MTALQRLTDREKYLLAILTGRTGIDLAEFAFTDSARSHGRYRLYDYQWRYQACEDKRQISACGRAVGKELALDTPVPTLDGWTTMGAIEAGQLVFDETGNPCRVTEVHDIVEGLDCYALTFSDGARIVASGRHRWATFTKRERNKSARSGREPQLSVVTTEEIAATLKVRGESNHSIPVAGPLQYPDTQLSLDPWVLGYWLGNGVSAQPYVCFSHDDAEFVLQQLTARGCTVKEMRTRGNKAPTWRFDPPGTSGKQVLGELSVLNNKHIPDVYLRAGERQRRDLLAGLFDSDGHQRADGWAEITVTNKRLASDVFDLVLSLGEKATFNEGRATIDGIDKGPKYRIGWTAQSTPAHMPRKVASCRNKNTSRVRQRRIVAVDPVPSVPVRCITVDSPSHLYLVGRELIPTHNTLSIVIRACTMPFAYRGRSMLLTAPELNHLRPLIDAVESRLLNTRMLREMLPAGKAAGMARQPHWQARFKNGTSIVSRLPQLTGRGIKGQHVTIIEQDECFPAGTLILLKRGLIPIEEVVVGDLVLTHRNRWRRVTDTMTRVRPTVNVRGLGHPGLRCSPNHKFWAMRGTESLVREGVSVAKKKAFLAPDFIPATELGHGVYWSTPLRLPAVSGAGIPSLEGRASRADRLKPRVDVQNADLYWVVGLWIAKGSVGSSRGKDGPLDRITFSINEDEVDEVFQRLDKVGLTPSGPYPVHDGRVNVILHGSEYTELADWLVRHFGRYAHGATVPSWALGLPEEFRRQLLDGLTHGSGYLLPAASMRDGENCATDQLKLTTVSRRLMVATRILAQSLGYSVQAHWPDASVHDVEIRGRKVDSHSLYQLVMWERSASQSFVYDDRQWSPIREVSDEGPPEELYDLTVDEDHSFVADGFYVSNSQDYPPNGDREIPDTLNNGDPGAMWRAHGVSKGIREEAFFERSQPGSGWTVHRLMAMHRPTWNDEERKNKIAELGGTRQSVDYKRNIYGEHGDASSAVFVLARLTACVDLDDGGKYNTDVYSKVEFLFERFPEGASDAIRWQMLRDAIRIPVEHLEGYSQRVGNREVGAPRGFSNYWAGMDVGVTNHPSEIVVLGQRTGTDFLELLLRVNLQRINTDDQKEVVRYLFETYGSKLAIGIDRNGVGFPIWDQLTRESFGDRVYGWHDSELRICAIEDRELMPGEKPEDLVKRRPLIESATDWLRNNHVDARALRLPNDDSLIRQFQGQTSTTVRDTGSPYGVKRLFSGGGLHALDAVKYAVASKYIPALERALADKPKKAAPVIDVFMGADMW